MAPRKLSETEKQEIIDLYRHPEESTSTLASRFGVSNSTISRILKQGLSSDEYEELVQQKRAGGMRSFDEAPALASEPAAEQQLPLLSYAEEPLSDPTPPDFQGDALIDVESQVLQEIEKDLQTSKSFVEAENNGFAAIDEDDNAALDDDLDDDLDDLDDADDDLDDDLDDDRTDGNLHSFVPIQANGEAIVEILPFSKATLPRTCYIVVDRLSELIARPLREFADLGRIPPAEIQAKTLPIFDNHRVARRFSKRMQRVVKVPDGRMLSKAGPYLQAKGITHLLIDGQIYAL